MIIGGILARLVPYPWYGTRRISLWEFRPVAGL